MFTDKLVIDVDDLESLNYCKAVYQLSYIPRKIVRTNKGVHVYFDLPHSFTLRVIFGDDKNRLRRDIQISEFKADLYVNVVFNTTEWY
jgi:hypothetical protein